MATNHERNIKNTTIELRPQWICLFKRLKQNNALNYKHLPVKLYRI